MTVTFRQLLLANESTRKLLLATIQQPRGEEEGEQEKPASAIGTVSPTAPSPLVPAPAASPTTAHNHLDSASVRDPRIIPDTTPVAPATAGVPPTTTTTSIECAAVGDACYEVEAIVDSRFNSARQRQEFLVKWVGYPSIWNSWEPSEHLQCPVLMEEFRQGRDGRCGFQTAQASDAHCRPTERGRPQLSDKGGDGAERREGAPAGPVHLTSRVRTFLQMMNRAAGTVAITLQNNIDDASPPEHFRCITDYIYRPPAPYPDPSFLVGCDCASSGGCVSGSCLCIAQNNDARPAYDSQGRLQFASGPIYECNSKCACASSCPNRVIQRGRQIPLSITRFGSGKGWGVTAVEPIAAGTFIERYLGEVITAAQANRRFLAAKERGPGDQSGSYLFDLDSNYESGVESEFTVDAYTYGNATHFINHSCSPNLRVHPCFIDNLDPRLHYLAFFALRDIQAGEELCFDYLGNHQTASSSSAPSSRRPPGKASDLTCRCGSSACRGFVY